MIKALTNRVNKLSVKADYWIKYFGKSILKYMSEEICFLTDDDEKELKEYILFLLENLEGKQMKNFELYNEYCILKGISACRYESIKQFAREFPEYCSYKK